MQRCVGAAPQLLSVISMPVVAITQKQGHNNRPFLDTYTFEVVQLLNRSDRKFPFENYYFHEPPSATFFDRN